MKLNDFFVNIKFGIHSFSSILKSSADASSNTNYEQQQQQQQKVNVVVEDNHITHFKSSDTCYRRYRRYSTMTDHLSALVGSPRSVAFLKKIEGEFLLLIKRALIYLTDEEYVKQHFINTRSIETLVVPEVRHYVSFIHCTNYTTLHYSEKLVGCLFF